MNDSESFTLAAKGRYKGDPLDGQVEQTHISWVILTRRFAFKIKKPLKLNFLDFSGLRQRKKFCEKELLLNQLFSQIYLDVTPVLEKDGAWEIGDVLSDIAFFCMDLEFYHQHSLSEIFVNQYADLFTCFQTVEDNVLFIYYKLTRANVRVKVHALSAMDSGKKSIWNLPGNTCS